MPDSGPGGGRGAELAANMCLERCQNVRRLDTHLQQLLEVTAAAVFHDQISAAGVLEDAAERHDVVATLHPGEALRLPLQLADRSRPRLLWSAFAQHLRRKLEDRWVPGRPRPSNTRANSSLIDGCNGP